MRALAGLALTALAGTCAAADVMGQLSFDWPDPTMTRACVLRDPAAPDRGVTRFTGMLEEQAPAVACIVEISRKRFDSLYRFCAVSSMENLPREHYACWVQYTQDAVVFHFSYSPESPALPRCAFACAKR